MANYAITSINFGNDNQVMTLPYGSCSTAAGTAAKTVSAGDFSLETGAAVVVKFTNTNTASNPTLNVSGTGAKAIYHKGAAINPNYLRAGFVYTFTYNGTQWDLHSALDVSAKIQTWNNATSPSSSVDIDELIINKVATNAILNSMQANGKINENEIYFVEEGGEMEIEAKLTSGTPIAEVKVDGTVVETIYAPAVSDDIATKSYVDTKVANIVDTAPETLNTLNELAAALGDDPSFATTITTQIGNKVDKVSGKGLSTNDYTTTEKNKLAGIAANANNYSHPTYTAKTSGLYKVTVDGTGHVSAATAVAKSDITGLGIPAQDTTYSAASTSADGLMTKAMVTKLNGIATGATANTGTVTSVSAGTGLTGGPITSSGSLSLASGVCTAGSYGPTDNVNGSNGATIKVPQITVDTYGRVTSVTERTYTSVNTDSGDTKVTQSAATTSNVAYPVLLGYSNATTAVTNTVNKSSKMTFNPSTGQLAITGAAASSTTTGALKVTGGIGASGNIYGSAVYGAVWNDYAEYREGTEDFEPGRVICENGDDTLSLATERLQPGANVVSDTFGFAIGETEKAKTPIAVSGRVLAYPYEDRNSYKPGDAVCAAPGGTVSKMTREEIREYPERILGTVSAIPTYEVWGEGKAKVNGRIWIKVR